MCQAPGRSGPSSARRASGPPGAQRLAGVDGLDVAGDHRRVDAPGRPSARRRRKSSSPSRTPRPAARRPASRSASKASWRASVLARSGRRVRASTVGHHLLGAVDEHRVAVAVQDERLDQVAADVGHAQLRVDPRLAEPVGAGRRPHPALLADGVQPARQQAARGPARGPTICSATKAADRPVLRTTGSRRPAAPARPRAEVRPTVRLSRLETGPSTSSRIPRGGTSTGHPPGCRWTTRGWRPEPSGPSSSGRA